MTRNPSFKALTVILALGGLAGCNKTPSQPAQIIAPLPPQPATTYVAPSAAPRTGDDDEHAPAAHHESQGTYQGRQEGANSGRQYQGQGYRGPGPYQGQAYGPPPYQGQPNGAGPYQGQAYGPGPYQGQVYGPGPYQGQPYPSRGQYGPNGQPMGPGPNGGPGPPYP